MVELTHNGKRYMVDGGQWFRRLLAGEVVQSGVQYLAYQTDFSWHPVAKEATPRKAGEMGQYRVPCTDPRPPFVVGQRVKVARKDADCGVTDRYIGVSADVLTVFADSVEIDVGEYAETFPPWCLDAVS